MNLRVETEKSNTEIMSCPKDINFEGFCFRIEFIYILMGISVIRGKYLKETPGRRLLAVKRSNSEETSFMSARSPAQH